MTIIKPHPDPSSRVRLVELLAIVLLVFAFLAAGEIVLGKMRGPAVISQGSPFHGGALTETTTLSAAHSPYVISKHIIVPTGVTLTIEPGVMLQFEADRSLQVKGGCLIAAGTVTQPIAFTRYGSGYWGGILLESTQADNRITHAVIEYTREAIYAPRTHGVSAYGSRITIADSVIRSTRASVAVQTYPWKGQYPTLYLLRNEIYNIESDAVHPSEGYAFIEGNYIHHIQHGIYPLEGIELSNMVTPAIVRHNHIHDISDDCMDLNYSSAIIEGNELHHCGDKGISIGHPSSTTLVNNLIHTCFGKDTDQYSGTGIAIKDGAVARIVNNTVSNCRHGIYLYEGHRYEGGGTATVVNTILWGNQSGLDLDPLSTVYVSYSDIEMDVGIWPGDGNLSVDPLFRDPTSGDYRLQKESPCVDAGTEVGAPSEDIQGVPRPQGKGYDIGAHESRCSFHGGTLVGDTTLLANCSPYVITDDITIPAGITLTVEPSVTLRFEAGRSLLVEGKLTAVGSSSRAVVFTRNSAEPWDGLRFQGSAANNHLAFATVEHVGFTPPIRIGIAAYSSTLYMERTAVRHITGTALILKNSEIALLDSVVHDIQTDGIRIVGGSAMIRGNHVYDVRGIDRIVLPNLGQGIEVTGTVEIATIQNNHIHHVAASCVALHRTTAIVARNELNHCEHNGLSVGPSSAVTLVNNLIYSCPGYLGETCSGVGVYVEGSAARVVNNTVTDNRYGIYGVDGGSATVVNSILWGNEKELETDALSAITVTYSDVYSTTATGTVILPGEGNINADPLFRAPQGGDYRLQENSLCIDAGAVVGAPAEDILGIHRPCGAGYDMGAHEFFEYFSTRLPLIVRSY